MIDALFQQASQAHARGDVATARQGYLRVLAAESRHAGALSNLGLILEGQGDIAGALACHQRAVEAAPQSWTAHYNLAQALRTTGAWDAAATHYRQSLSCKPDAELAWLGLAVALSMLGREEEALGAYNRGLAIPTQNAEAHAAMLCNRALLQRQRGQMEPAERDFRQAIAAAPRHALPLNNLAELCFVTGRVAEAVQLAGEAWRREPTNAMAASGQMFYLNYLPGVDDAAMKQALAGWEAALAAPLPRMTHPPGRREDAEKRLKVGYVSPDFRDHCQAMFMAPLLARHDRERFEIVGYSDCARPDAVTAKIRGMCDGWRETSGMSDEQLAGMIAADKVDVLVDLTMHMAGNRLLMFARKPAPVQVTWLAYPGSTGLGAMDYRLSDPHLDPVESNDGIYREKTWRLPATFWCFDPGDVPTVGELPARQAGHITFGCLNNFCKVNDGVLALWARVMAQVAGSQLHLLADEGLHRGKAIDVLRSHGVEAGRVRFLPRTSRQAYMAYYNAIDIGLDTVPYNGHTTSLDAFYMGVPVVTLVGPRVVGRGGLSQLKNLGLEELVAQTPEGFIEIAEGLAADKEQLQKLRQGLRARMVASPLMDAEAFARGFESALRQMWRRHCGAGDGTQ